MDRLQTKCLMASAGFHVLVAVIVVTCSAVHWRRPLNAGSRGDTSIIQLVSLPADQEAAPTTAAGSRHVAAPKSIEAPQRPIQRTTASTESTALRHRELAHSAKATTSTDARLAELSRALENVAHRVPAGKAIALELNSDKSGQDDSYARIVKFLYSQSWEPASGENVDSKASAKVRVTIASDGKVSTASIIEPSGDARLDESVRQTLDRVQFIEPFEPGARESERTYTINFNLHTALSAGP